MDTCTCRATFRDISRNGFVVFIRNAGDSKRDLPSDSAVEFTCQEPGCNTRYTIKAVGGVLVPV